MTIENPLYDTSIGGKPAKSRAVADLEYRVYKILKALVLGLQMAFFAIVTLFKNVVKEIVRPGSSSRI